MAAATPEVPHRTFARCPLCYTRVVLGPDDGAAAAVYAHELSGFCAGHVLAKVRKPPKNKRDNDSKTHSNSPGRLNDWTAMFDDA